MTSRPAPEFPELPGLPELPEASALRATSLMRCPSCDKRGVNLRLRREDHWGCRYCGWSAFTSGADTVDVEGRIPLRARNLPHPFAPRTKFRATFIPQTCLRDYAVDADLPGENQWVVSDELVPAAARIVAGYPLADLVGDGVIDNHDILQSDPAAPDWVRDWSARSAST
ncbi:hypothetical protein [Terracoccus luteus]|uniref:Uncharacterized protein n=1 Tax=Terracoccus luteus TaxID=53356 RepID=A0A839Q781_9MICO|nr:hypothetical protein [Terracoccus luteus]MBB2988501.1 hypothetical protein [Terracoccus luteus]MCP2174152.1 hypothetical protein [Terracoccus luteus]